MVPSQSRFEQIPVTLRDGRKVIIRPISRTDADRLVLFHESLSDRTIYQRFFAAHPHLSEHEIKRFTHVDHNLREAYVAISEDEIVAVGRLETIDENCAEVAFVIRDAFQKLGLGSALFSLLAETAREQGISTFVAEVLPQNKAMIRLFEVFGESITKETEDGVTHIEVGLGR
jgi:RimJ/RimL family protein N-acetyltransferase